MEKLDRENLGEEKASEADTIEDVEKEEKELEELKRKFSELQEESRKLKNLVQEQVENITSSAVVDKEEVDARSCWVGNVDFGATPEEVKEHFQACGSIVRVTILVDKFTGHPKGFAYVEFLEKESVANALELNESIFRNRPLKVSTKRTNIPATTLRGFHPRMGFRRGRRRFRSRRAYFHPYA
eukprot:TRINITY_DN977_c0_g1_i1.p1 TRINITY_DN977_c0_g1~~TRINITY_DN977_c0_g1_i1.p1  ORF type:complete len:184 (+),score=46.10 TRINITY_DN977_c0_g1_i1:114-665(+)